MFLEADLSNQSHVENNVDPVVARWLDPLKPEKIDHVITALACLVGTALAILASLLTGFALS